MRKDAYSGFRQLCREHSLAATYQRHKIYQALMSRPHGHYSPEEIYDEVRHDLPSISLATVYKNLKTFVQAGILRDVSPHHGTWRVDANLKPHHHLVCTQCHSIQDLDIDLLSPVSLHGDLPAGFRMEKCSVEVQGVCRACSTKKSKQH